MEASKWQVSAGGDTEPKWALDGRTLYFLGPADLMAAEVTTSPTFAHKTPEAVLDRAAYASSGGRRNYDVAPEGERFLLLEDAATDDSDLPRSQINIVQNWVEELKRLVPVE